MSGPPTEPHEHLDEREDEDPEHEFCHGLAGGGYVALPALLSGRVFTHRVSEEEAQAQALTVIPDLELLFWAVADKALPEDEQGRLVGAPGWLGAVAPGQLVAVGWRDGVLAAEPVEGEPDAWDDLASALGAAFSTWSESPEDGALLVDIVVQCLVDTPQSFTRPAPPLVELLAACGLEHRGDRVGVAGFDWELPAVRALHEREEMLEAVYDFSECCHEALARSLVGFVAHASEAEPPSPAVLKALAHGQVAEAFAREIVVRLDDLHEAAVEIGDFARALTDVARGRERAPAHYLRAIAAEGQRDVLGAEAFLESALHADADFVPALTEAARYAEDRGDAARAIALLRRAGAEPDDPQLELLSLRLPAPSRVPRNAACPCGSGRKHKACCLGKGPALSDRVAWLYEKAAAFVRHPSERDAIIDLAERLTRPSGEAPRDFLLAIGDPFLNDLAVFEGGALGRFLALRGPLLPADERALAGRWLDTRRALFEILEVHEGEGLGLRDTRTGEATRMHEPGGGEGWEVGEMVLGRLVPSGDGARLTFIGQVIRVPLAQREALLELTGVPEPALAEDWVDWLRSTRGPPRVTNMEGEETLLCDARYRIASAEGACEALAAGAGLERGEGSEEPATFHQHVEIDGQSILRGVVVVEGDELRIETNSAERMERLTELVQRLVPDAELREERRRTVDEALTDPERPAAEGGAEAFPLLSEALPDEAAAVLREHVEGFSRRWVDESIPALGGLTPRQALDDPTRREDLMALLREMERAEAEAPPGIIPMPMAPIRESLGLG